MGRRGCTQVNSAAPISYLVDSQGCQIVARVVGGDLRVAHLGHPQALLAIVQSAACTFHAHHYGQKRARDELHAAQLPDRDWRQDAHGRPR